MSTEDERTKKRRKSAGRTLLAIPFALVGFTAAMVYVPPPADQPLTASEKLRNIGIQADIESALDAASTDDTLVLQLLRDSGVNLGAAGPDGSTPLARAALSGSHAAARYLTKAAPSSINSVSPNGLSPIAHAVTAAKPAIIETLVAAGADPHSKGSWDRPLLLVAATRMHAETVHSLLQCGATDGIDRALVTAVKAGDELISRHLLDAGADPNTEASPGSPLIHSAVASGDPAIIELLANRGSDLSALDFGKRTALGAAIDAENADGIHALLAQGADLDQPSHGSSTPLEVALEGRSTTMMETLLKLGATPHPKMLASAYNAEEAALVNLLVNHGVPMDAPVADGDTLLAAQLHGEDGPNLSKMQELLALGCDPNSITKEGQPVLAIAIAKRSPAAVQLLLEEGADPNTTLSSPTSEAFLKLLDSRVLSYYMTRDSRFTPLMAAAGVGEPDVIRQLIKHGASKIKYTRRWKRYPISFASESKHIEAQQLIVGYDKEKREDQYKMIISLSKQRVTLYKNGKAINSSTVSTGKRGYRTPKGEYVVTHKHRHHNSTLYGSSMPYFMRFSCDAFGTHTGVCPGYPASHGCIRMPNSKARAFFYAAPTGTPVSIVN